MASNRGTRVRTGEDIEEARSVTQRQTRPSSPTTKGPDQPVSLSPGTSGRLGCRWPFPLGLDPSARRLYGGGKEDGLSLLARSPPAFSLARLDIAVPVDPWHPIPRSAQHVLATDRPRSPRPDSNGSRATRLLSELPMFSARARDWTPTLQTAVSRAPLGPTPFLAVDLLQCAICCV